MDDEDFLQMLKLIKEYLSEYKVVLHLLALPEF